MCRNFSISAMSRDSLCVLLCKKDTSKCRHWTTVEAALFRNGYYGEVLDNTKQLTFAANIPRYCIKKQFLLTDIPVAPPWVC